MLPAELATGSSIMPHKRNPDLFELTRARAAALEGDLVTLLQIKGKLAGGYQRDFQLLKEPLMRGLDRAAAMLSVMAHAIPRSAWIASGARPRSTAAPSRPTRSCGGSKVDVPFRTAYREVAAALEAGERFRRPAGQVDRRPTCVDRRGGQPRPRFRSRPCPPCPFAGKPANGAGSIGP